MCGIISSFILLLVGFMCASGIHAYPSRNFQHSLTQQNMQTVLNSIEERLRNLDKLCGYRQTNAFDENVRRLEVLESKIHRFESILTSQFDKIEGNMSMQYFKDDIARDQVLRKIDAVYERVHHKMFHNEMKIDTSERKIMEKLEIMFERFEHLEDTLTTRISDIEFEILDGLKEMKVNVNVEMENLTKTLSHNLGNKVFVLKPKFETILHAINDTSENIKRDIQMSKLSNEERSPPSREQLHTSIKKLESIVNSTRYEHQNAMRNLVIQVGRLEGKNNFGDSNSHQSQQLRNISRNIADKFDTLIEQQSVFLDSCHRIQSDEPQLESKISEILEKIIDVFEKESAIEKNDIQNIEQLIKSHDTTVRRSLYTTSHNMGVLLQKGKEHKDEIAQQVAMFKGSIDELTRKLNEHPPRIFGMIQDLRSDLSKIDHNGSQVQVVLDEIRNVIHTFSENTTEQRSIDKNNIEIIRSELQNVSVKMEVFYQKIEKLLKDYVNNTSNRSDVDLDEAISEVFGSGVNNTYLMENVNNCSSVLLDVRCTNCTNANTQFGNCSDSRNISNGTCIIRNSNEKLPSITSNDDIKFDFDLRNADNKNSSTDQPISTGTAILNVTRLLIANQTEALPSQTRNEVETPATNSSIISSARHDDGNLTEILHNESPHRT